MVAAAGSKLIPLPRWPIGHRNRLEHRQHLAEGGRRRPAEHDADARGHPPGRRRRFAAAACPLAAVSRPKKSSAAGHGLQTKRLAPGGSHRHPRGAVSTSTAGVSAAAGPSPPPSRRVRSARGCQQQGGSAQGSNRFRRSVSPPRLNHPFGASVASASRRFLPAGRLGASAGIRVAVRMIQRQARLLAPRLTTVQAWPRSSSQGTKLPSNKARASQEKQAACDGSDRWWEPRLGVGRSRGSTAGRCGQAEATGQGTRAQKPGRADPSAHPGPGTAIRRPQETSLAAPESPWRFGTAPRRPASSHKVFSAWPKGEPATPCTIKLAPATKHHQNKATTRATPDHLLADHAPAHARNSIQARPSWAKPAWASSNGGLTHRSGCFPAPARR